MWHSIKKNAALGEKCCWEVLEGEKKMKMSIKQININFYLFYLKK